MELDTAQAKMVIDYCVKISDTELDKAYDLEDTEQAEFKEIEKLGLCALIQQLKLIDNLTTQMNQLYDSEVILQKTEGKNTQLLQNAAAVYEDIAFDILDILCEICVMYLGKDKVEDLLN